MNKNERNPALMGQAALVGRHLRYGGYVTYELPRGATAVGILAYGFNLSCEENRWCIKARDTSGHFAPGWYDLGREEFAEEAFRRLLTSVGLKIDPAAKTYARRRREAVRRLGVYLIPYVNWGVPQLYLAAHHIVFHDEHVPVIDMAGLERQRAMEGWDAKLAHAKMVLDLEYEVPGPGWYVTAFAVDRQSTVDLFR
ncbi:hypothetical protein F0L68_35590 [Solihabitans fulvus]|uniref:Uncharacterized protein n=1 Tax=Solihabitans fulvus TaxID=1892852 RepID=A0A5B2WPE2_9PSEU|nr:hypothetical protein [Solihabitans fulvus]KAA2252376.1 hypothetical protein F0L68_35590 [Solihabitans fulvus]